MPPELRPRTSKIKPDVYTTAFDALAKPTPQPSEAATSVNSMESRTSAPPVYTIDLSLPPAQRYVESVNVHLGAICALVALFDDILDLSPVHLPKRLIHFVARMLLRKVYSKEETEELRGIAETAKLPMYLLVAYNVLLDLLMGCTSGGALAQPPDGGSSRMMHFRTLDWAMPELRDVIVQYDFVTRPGGEVIARTISYVGFVGVLTGVRQDLSVSLNFRPYHNNDSSFLANAKFYSHQLAVLLGYQPSIASILRDFIIPRITPVRHDNRSHVKVQAHPRYGEQDISTTLPTTRTTSAYLILTTPTRTTTLEKDITSAQITHSSTFTTITNHDTSYDTSSSHSAHASQSTLGGTLIHDLVAESVDRKACLMKKWGSWRKKKAGVPLETLKEWVLEFPTCNEQTHFVCIMDPASGEVSWVRVFEEGEIQGWEWDGDEEREREGRVVCKRRRTGEVWELGDGEWVRRGRCGHCGRED